MKNAEINQVEDVNSGNQFQLVLLESEFSVFGMVKTAKHSPSSFQRACESAAAPQEENCFKKSRAPEEPETQFLT